MKLSARNVIPGTVVAVVRGQTTGNIKVDIGGGITVTSSITMEATDDLGLKVGDRVSVVIKSSDIIIGK